MVASLKFFLGTNEEKKESDNSDSDNEVDPKEVAMANKVNKKSRKREKLLKKVKKVAAKQYKKKSSAPAFNFSAIHLIYDPQGGYFGFTYRDLQFTCMYFYIKILK